jgi:G:T-mismatch repair DNA endonuclease (very short patch repair protein)
MNNFCQCGCGSEIAERKRYKHGHHRKGKKFPGQKQSPRPHLRGIPTWNKGKTWSQDVRDKIALAHRGKKDGPCPEERKRNIAAAQKGVPRPYARDNPQIFQKGLTPWNKNKTDVYTEEMLEVIRINRAKQILPIKDTGIEVIIQNELTKLGIKFARKSFRIRGFTHTVDLFTEPDIAIECDGDYWHSRLISSKDILRIHRDYIIDFELERIGIKVVRLWEYDINNNLPWCIKQITSRIPL